MTVTIINNNDFYQGVSSLCTQTIADEELLLLLLHYFPYTFIMNNKTINNDKKISLISTPQVLQHTCMFKLDNAISVSPSQLIYNMIMYEAYQA